VIFSRKYRRIIYVLAALIVAAIVAVSYFGAKYSPNRLFTRDSTVTVSLNGEIAPNAQAYRSAQGVWLIDMGNGTEWYGYLRDDQYLMTCQPPLRIPLPRSLYLMRDVLPCVHFGEVMASNPHLLVTPQSIEFDSREHRGRVKVTWF